MDNKEQNFKFTYSAKEQEEIEKIRKQYLPQEEDKMARLRRLDRIPHQKAQSRSLCLGVIGALILGTGMSLTMTQFGNAVLGDVWSMVLGIIAGLLGLVLVALAYPVYNRILKKERQRIAPAILQLTDELLK